MESSNPVKQEETKGSAGKGKVVDDKGEIELI